jgi:hypothetical protein
MRFKAWHLYRFVLVGGTLVALSCAPGGAWAQQNGNNNPAQSSQAQTSAQFQMQGQGQLQGQDVHWSDWAALDQFLNAHPDIAAALRANPDLIYDQNFMGQHTQFRDFCNGHPGIQQDLGTHPEFKGWFGERTELMSLTNFLSSDAEVRSQLEANPRLVDDPNYLKDHPGLAQFLNSNPQVKQAIDRNPTGFMNLETHFVMRLAISERPDAMVMNQFFVAHPDIEKELAAKPWLVNDQTYLKAHPALEAFLNSHPQLRQTFDQDPILFMSVEAHLQTRPEGGGYNRVGYPNPNGNYNNSGEVRSMDQFLNSNPQIAKQLEANPSLIDNVKYLNDHPQLRAFLNSNPQIREAFIQNPSMFFHGQQFQAGANSSDVATMDAYMDKHPDVARDLNAYPARINDSDYLAHHKDLEAFLKKHPNVRDEFTHNPSAFMHQESSFDACAQMDDFLDNHKNVAKDLNSNPENVKDVSFLDHHKDLMSFLAKNPGVSDQVQNNPAGFMDQEKRFESNRQMDVYLSNHKSVAKDLQKNPDQVKNASYLDHHKDLKQVLDKNPELAEAANTNPAGFWQEQVKFQQDYKNKQVQDKSKVQERATTHGPQ